MEFLKDLDYEIKDTVSDILSEISTVIENSEDSLEENIDSSINIFPKIQLPILLGNTSDIKISAIIDGENRTMLESNWIIEGLLCCGAFPDGPYDVDILYANNINLMINCRREGGDYVVPSSINKQRIRLTDKTIIPYEKLTEIIDICENICNMMIFEQKKIYIHCYGGHGRTGLLVCIILHLLYGYSAEEAIDKAQTLHHMRPLVPEDIDKFGNITHKQVRMPQTDSQIKQLHMLFGETRDSIPKEYFKIRDYIESKRQHMIEKLN